jgi:hypothetical protein
LLFIYAPWFFLLKYDLAATYVWWLFAWTLVILFFGINRYLLWLLNVTLITNQRVILAHYKNLLSKKISETPLDRVVALEIEKRGLWQNLFDYGDVAVKIYGAVEPLVLSNVKNPEREKNELWKTAQKTNVPDIKAARLARPVIMK